MTQNRTFEAVFEAAIGESARAEASEQRVVEVAEARLPPPAMAVEVPPMAVAVEAESLGRAPPDPTPEQRLCQGQAVVRFEARRQRRRFGLLIELEEAEAQGRVALAEALVSYDPARGSFRAYVRRKAEWAILTGARRDAHCRGGAGRARVLRAGDLPLRAHEGFVKGLGPATQSAWDVGTAARLPGDPDAGEEEVLVAWDEAGVPSAVPTPEEELARAQVQRLVAEAIERLPERQRALVYRYLRDETITAIAADLGLSKSWVSRLLDQALETLRRTLGHLP